MAERVGRNAAVRPARSFDCSALTGLHRRLTAPQSGAGTTGGVAAFVFTLCLEPPQRQVLGRHTCDRPLDEGDVVHTADGEAWVVRRLFSSEDDLTNEGVAYCVPLNGSSGAGRRSGRV